MAMQDDTGSAGRAPGLNEGRRSEASTAILREDASTMILLSCTGYPTLSREADLYLLDEPSAHLDVEQRMLAAKVMRRFAESAEKTVLVVDHDIYLIDLLSERLMVFEGQPGLLGIAGTPLEMREGMNAFLKGLDITFRRDEETRRPRVNKPGSRLDRGQKEQGEYYYLVEEN